MSDELGPHNAMESIDGGWIRYCHCGGQGWPELNDNGTISVYCFRCNNKGADSVSVPHAVKAWNEQERK